MIFIFKRVQCTLANETLMCTLLYNGDDEVRITRSVPHTTHIQDTQHDPHPIITRRVRPKTHTYNTPTHTTHNERRVCECHTRVFRVP
ncbi:hypothetical protein DPMN_024579 [Dreissena polymorpha]|uniref:Uncharacterized protein n=1 Tax=Dreissena polymorpha TaxID=45954 RepID=A0A9D4RCT8_DREPO|nr:hypothetical protein DPMN_024579 [Dreissena polymorpha]